MTPSAFLSDDARGEMLLEVAEMCEFAFGHAVDRYAGHVGHDLRYDVDRNHLPVLGGEQFVARGGQDGLPLLHLEAELHRLLEVAGFGGARHVGLHHLYLALEPVQAGRRGAGEQPGLGARLVHDVYGLVGQEPAADEPVGQAGAGLNRVGGVLRTVVLFVLASEAVEDLDRQRHRRRIDRDGLEAPLQCAVLLDAPPVLVERSGADALELASGESGLEQVRRVDGAFGGARAHDGMDLVDEKYDVAGFDYLLEQDLQPLLELPPVLRAGYDARHVQRHEPAVAERGRDAAGDDQLGEALDDRGLTHSGFADQDGIALLPAAENLDDPRYLLLASDHGVQ